MASGIHICPSESAGQCLYHRLMEIVFVSFLRGFDGGRGYYGIGKASCAIPLESYRGTPLAFPMQAHKIRAPRNQWRYECSKRGGLNPDSNRRERPASARRSFYARIGSKKSPPGIGCLLLVWSKPVKDAQQMVIGSSISASFRSLAVNCIGGAVRGRFPGTARTLISTKHLVHLHRSDGGDGFFSALIPYSDYRVRSGTELMPVDFRLLREYGYRAYHACRL